MINQGRTLGDVLSYMTTPSRQYVKRSLMPLFIEIIDTNRSTLFFANSRRMTEKITRMINEKQGVQTAYAHHGSLSREIRTLVEEKLKAGELKAIVATNSLELGIDIGFLDEIILVQAPFSVVSVLQKIGRGGHGVDETSRAQVFPLHGMDFVLSSVIARARADW